MKKKPGKKKLNTTSMRALKAFKAALENGGNVSKAMREAGYSEAFSKNPQKLKETEAWQKLMEEHLPDDDLAKVHRKLLKDKSYKARTSGLDMAYKLKGKYAAEKKDLRVGLTLSALLDEADKNDDPDLAG